MQLRLSQHAPKSPDGCFRVDSQRFNHSQYAISTDKKTYCYARLAVSSPVVATANASTHCANSRRDGQTEFAWVAW